MLGIPTSFVIGTGQINNAGFLHILFYGDVGIGILVMASFAITRILKKLL